MAKFMFTFASIQDRIEPHLRIPRDFGRPLRVSYLWIRVSPIACKCIANNLIPLIQAHDLEGNVIVHLDFELIFYRLFD